MAIATVISITGEAYVRDENGNLRELSVGDTLEEGEVLVTSDNGRVQLDFGDGIDPTVIEGGQQVAMTPDLMQGLTDDQGEDGEAVAEDESSAMDEDVEALLAAIEEGDDDLLAGLDATAAGAGAGGGEGGGHDFVRLVRITENTDPLAFEFSTASLDSVEFDEAEPELLEATVSGSVSFELFSGEVNVGGDSVVEGNTFTLVATLDTAPVDTPLVINLSNGQQITIPVGETSGEVVLDSREDDLFVQGDESIDLSVSSATGGGFDELTVGEVPSLTVVDDDDASTVSLSGPESVTELDDITLTATVDNAPETDLTLTLDNGEQIVIPAGQTSGSVTFASPNVPDGDGEQTFTIEEAEGGNYEALEIDSASQTTEIIDRLPEAGEEADQLDDADLLAGNAVTTGTLDLDFGGDGAGSVDFAAMDGQSGTLGTEAITYSWNAGTNTLTATGPRGDLFNVVVDPENGAYTATLVDNVLHEEGSDQDSLPLTYTVTDADDSTADGVFTLSFVDDGPEANNDIDQVPPASPTAASPPITGNVTANDTEGADTPTVVTQVSFNGAPPTGVPATGSVDIDGDFGTLTISADGNYTYQRTSGSGDVEDVFTYTLTDDDGDSDTATLTIAIGDAGVDIGGLTPEGGAADEVVDEANLSDGSDPDSDALTQTGFFTISAPDGVGTLSVGGTTVISNDVFTAQTITTPLGNTLQITDYDPSAGVVSYSYTLNDNEDHDPIQGENSLFEDFVVSLEDNDGDATTGSLRVEIVDDVPTAVDDEADAPEDTAITVDVLDNDIEGADGASLTAASLRDSGAGSISFDSNGNITFDPTPGFEGDAVIDYTITDADDDTSDAVLTVTVAPDSEPVISITAESDSVNEAGLPQGSANDGSHITTGTFAIDTGNDSLASLVINGTDVTGGGSVSGNNNFGTLVVTQGSDGSYNWIYTLDDATDEHSSQGPNIDGVQDGFTLVATDSDGSIDNDTLTIDIVDDVPSMAVSGADSVTEGGSAVTGTWDNASYGADGADSVKVLIGTDEYDLDTDITVTEGTLNVANDGTWSFTPVDALTQPVSLTFRVEVTDNDGDVASDSHTINILDGQGPGDANSVTLTVDEDSITDTDSDTVTFSLGSDALTSMAFSADLTSLTTNNGEISWVRNSDTEIVGEIGSSPAVTLTLTPDLAAGTASVAVSLADNVTHPTANGENTLDLGSINVVATETDGDQATGTVNIKVIDDVPAITTFAAQQEAALVLDESAGPDTVADPNAGDEADT
ncbi:retention module-containing protein, partial [Halomonas lysinitropha]